MATVAEVKDEIHRIWRSSFQTELDDALEAELRRSAVVGIKATLESAVRAELDRYLGFGRYERQPSGKKPPAYQRSGSYRRQVETEYGPMADLQVPKLRTGNRTRPWQILQRYRRARQLVLDKALYLYALGLSLRDLQEALYLFLGRVLSRRAVNQVTLDVQRTMAAWRAAPIPQTPPILIVDGVWVTILYPTGAQWTDRAGHQREEVRGHERVILTVVAVWPDGRHHILHDEGAANEDASTWSTLLQHLIARGLDPQAVQVVVSDGTPGLLEALAATLPTARLQRCTVHQVRGFERSLGTTDLPTTDPQTGQPLTREHARQQRRQAIQAEALAIFEAPTRAEAEQRLAAFVATWQPLEPQAVHSFTWGLTRCFTFYHLDPALHPLVRSTNLLERFFREFRTKADEIGAFPNEVSCLTVFHLVMVREHAKHDRVDFANTG